MKNASMTQRLSAMKWMLGKAIKGQMKPRKFRFFFWHIIRGQVVMAEDVVTKPCLPSSEDALFFGKGYPAQILSVTKDCVRYVDSQQNEHEIDLHACGKLGDEKEDFGTGRHIGFRKLVSRPPSVFFFDSTRMEFESSELAYCSVLNELMRHKWYTCDLD